MNEISLSEENNEVQEELVIELEKRVEHSTLCTYDICVLPPPRSGWL
jgi:hypothetical protein